MNCYIKLKNGDSLNIDNLQEIRKSGSMGPSETIKKFDDFFVFTSSKYIFVGARRIVTVDGNEIIHVMFDN